MLQIMLTAVARMRREDPVDAEATRHMLLGSAWHLRRALRLEALSVAGTAPAALAPL